MTPPESPAEVTLVGLFSYPVKGCRVIPHDGAHVAVTGLAHDRAWMIVDTSVTPAQFASQRDTPALATIETHVGDDGRLELSAAAASAAPLVVAPTHCAGPLAVRVWRHDTIALDAGDAAAAWLAAVLGTPPGRLRLVRFDTSRRRDCNAAFAGDSGAHTLFADGYPVLIGNAASLDDLNVRMAATGAAPIDIGRFRPNLVLRGLAAWDEDYIDSLDIGSVRLRLVKPSVRCLVTTTDQKTGQRMGDEPLATLARFRNDTTFGGVTFGWNAVVLAGGRVKLGDRVAVNYRF